MTFVGLIMTDFGVLDNRKCRAYETIPEMTWPGDQAPNQKHGVHGYVGRNKPDVALAETGVSGTTVCKVAGNACSR